MSARRAVGVLAMVLATLMLAGCASMPTSGPVVTIGQIAAPTPDAGFAIAPRGPQKGASAAEVVQGFLDAMQATPVQTTTARQFLSSEFADAWDPQRQTITYSDLTPPHGSSVVSVDLQGANRLDAQGAWQGAAGLSDSQLHFSMVKEKGEWRISEAPNALIVPQSWFDARFTQVSLYYFDPTGQILVPEPVFVPRGNQLATTLVRSLLAGPSDALDGVARTFLPAGISPGLSVPVDGNGVASVDLKGDLGQQSDHALHLMSTQLAWTLHQDDSIRAIRLSIGGRTVEQAGASEIPIDTGQPYDPAGYAASDQLFGIFDGGVVTATSVHLTPVPGALGGHTPELRSVAVSMDAAQAAAVTADGRQLRTAALRTDARATVRLTGTDLLTPAWDVTDRLWDVDRTADGAVVHVSDGSQMQTVAVPGVSGQNVRRFLISRDGSRLVALVRHGDGDEVVVSRIRSGDQGRVLGAAGAQVISGPSQGVRIRDIGWHSPTSVVTLQQLSGTALIRTFSVDGAISGFPAATVTVGHRLSAIVSSPLSAQTVYGVAGNTLLDLSGAVGETGTVVLAGRVTSLGYVG